MDPETCFACGHLAMSENGRMGFETPDGGEPVCDGCTSRAQDNGFPMNVREAPHSVQLATEHHRATLGGQPLPVIGYRLEFTVGIVSYGQDIYVNGWASASYAANRTMDIVIDGEHDGPDTMSLTRIDR